LTKGAIEIQLEHVNKLLVFIGYCANMFDIFFF